MGAKVGFTNATADNDIVKEKSNLFTAGVFGRYYWMPASKFSIFAELGADYRNSSFDSGVAGSSKSKSNGFGAVSYTHLDVYKRQILFFSKNFLLIFETTFPKLSIYIISPIIIFSLSL